jgi:sulfonate transport system permease protein
MTELAPVPPPIPSTPLLRRAARLQAAIRKPDYRPLALPIAFVLLWAIATSFHWVDTRFLVGPATVAMTAWHDLIESQVWEGLGYSLARDLGGFAIGTSIGILIGTLIGTSRFADRIISPSFHAFKQIAVFAWIPLISVWFGMGELAKVMFIALVVIPPVLLNTFEGIRAVTREHIEVARVFEFRRLQIFRRVILPSATPQLATGIRLGLIYAWLATIGAEYFLRAGPGIGNLIIDGREHFLLDQVIVGVVVVGAVGYAQHDIASRVEARLLHWRRRSTLP